LVVKYPASYPHCSVERNIILELEKLTIFQPVLINIPCSLNLGVCILLRVLDQVQEFPSNATLVSIIVYYFIQIRRYMFRSYDHLHEETYT
jgi:hypothetical protein